MLLALTAFCYGQGDLVRAERHARDGLLAARRARNRYLLYGCLNSLGLACTKRNDYAAALRCFEPAVRRLRRRGGDPAELSIFASNLAIALKGLGRFDEAVRIHEDLLVRERATGDAHALLVRLNNLGNVHRSRRDYARALPCFEEALVLSRQHGIGHGRSLYAVNCGLTLLELDDLPASARALEDVLEECRREPQVEAEVAAHLGLARIAVRSRDIDAGCRHLAPAGRMASDNAMEGNFASVMTCLAEAELARGERGEAAVLLLWADSRHNDAAELRLTRELLAGLALTEAERSSYAAHASACTQAQLLAALEARQDSWR